MPKKKTKNSAQKLSWCVIATVWAAPGWRHASHSVDEGEDYLAPSRHCRYHCRYRCHCHFRCRYHCRCRSPTRNRRDGAPPPRQPHHLTPE